MADKEQDQAAEVVQTPKTAVIVREEVRGLVRPMATLDDMQQQYAAFQDFKSKFLQGIEGGVISMWAPGGEKDYVAKPGWVAARTFFRIDTRVVREGWEALPDGTMQFKCVVRAQAKNGDFCEAVGVCDTSEPFYQGGTKLNEGEAVPEGVKVYHLRKEVYENGRPTGHHEWRRYLPKNLSAVVGFAQTRAQNRAISTLCGGGENSYEEITDGGGSRKPASSTGQRGEQRAAQAAAGDPEWWVLGKENPEAATEALDKDGANVSVKAIIRFPGSDVPMAGSKTKNWPVYADGPWAGKTWRELLALSVAARRKNPALDAASCPLENMLETPGRGAYKGKGNWIGEMAAAMVHVAIQAAKKAGPPQESEKAPAADGKLPLTEAPPKNEDGSPKHHEGEGCLCNDCIDEVPF